MAQSLTEADDIGILGIHIPQAHQMGKFEPVKGTFLHDKDFVPVGKAVNYGRPHTA